MIVTSKSSSEATRVDYNLTGNYSNVYYNIYLVTVPDVKNLPMWFRVGQSVRKTNGDFTSVNYFTNPHIEKIQNGEVANYEEIIKQSKYETWFVNSTEKIDTILVQSAVKYDYCGVGLDNPEVKLTVSSIDKLGGQAYREKIYTRTLSLGEIIMIPFATEAEAKAAADNLDAFNDKVLQEATNAKKE
ncbi:MAG: hypothetical protein HUK02_05875 [Bacteroidaceae bacterium]|nr:hypothetical protein [Bacteroidaceae bacterium]